jgi:hypothetical protein
MSEIFQNKPKPSSKLLKPESPFAAELQTEEESTHPSLQAYLSKRIFENQPLKNEPHAKIPGINQTMAHQHGLITPQPEATGPDPNTVNGNLLNTLDTQLSAGLEQYLPTPAIRLRIIKDRLTTEVTSLTEQLEKYKALNHPPADIQTKIPTLQERLVALKVHEKQIDAQLAGLFSAKNGWIFTLTRLWTSVSNQLSQTGDAVGRQLSGDALMERFDPQRFQLVSMNRQLGTLADVLSDQMNRATPSSVEVSTLITQYDQTVKQVEQIAETYRNQQSWRERWSEAIMRAVRKLYS